MKKSLLKTICIALVAVLCIGSLNAQMARTSNGLIKKTENTNPFQQLAAQEHYKVVVPTTPAPKGMINVTLNVPTDVWGYGEGYQLLLDQTATQYGQAIPAEGPFCACNAINPNAYNVFSHTIPPGAVPACQPASANPGNWVFMNSVTIQIPAGTYDWCVVNPETGNQLWIVGVNGRYDNYVFQDGKKYMFTISGDGYTEDICTITIEDDGTPDPDCDPATNLAVTYAEDCSKATLTWDEPAKSRGTILWDNTNIDVTTSGLLSQYWSGNDNWIFTADDFVADGPWIIEKIYSQGFSNAPAVLPTNFMIVIYENGTDNKPGAEIYKSASIPVTNGGEPEITLPTPFQLPAAGTYWITIAGVYNASVSTNAEITNYRWNIYYGTIAKGYEQHLYDKLALIAPTPAAWFSVTSLGVPAAKSMYFKIEGTNDGPGPSDLAFNIYRDGELIEENLNAITYEDTDFDPAVGHTWSVKVVCEEGGESDAISVTEEACEEEGDCDPATNLTVEYDGCTKAELNWEPPTKSPVYKPTYIFNEPSESTVEPQARAAATTHTVPTTHQDIFSASTMKGGNVLRGDFYEDVEDHPDFVINSTVNGWSYIDGDMSPTYAFQSVDFPNDYEPMAYIVFNPSLTTPPMTDAGIQPHGGSKYFASFAAVMPADGGSGPNNDWIISPELVEPSHISFWAKSYTAQYGQERMKVGYSTTGTAQSDFTIVSPGAYVSVPATAWTKYDYDIPSNAKYIAINCVSADAFVFMLDDITITTSGAEPVKYNIYRDDIIVKANHTSTSYTDTGFDPTQEHTWAVRVVCEEGGLSAPVSKKLDPCSNDECLPATITQVTLTGANSLFVEWTYPVAKGEVTITQSYAPGTGVIGSSGQLSFGVYNRFRPEDLVAVNGGELNKFVFIPGMGSDQGGEPHHNYTIRIYQGGSWSATPSERNPGTLIFSQPLNNADLDFETGMDNIIMLTTPIIIDASKELWIGYFCQATSPGGYPALTDVGPRKSGLGDVMNYQGWTTLYDVLSDSPYNWYMQGKVQFTPSTVDIYRNDVVIKPAYEGTSYTDTQLPVGEYCYSLVVNCPTGSTSEKCEEKCEIVPDNINENIKAAFSIVPNPATNNITITSGTNFHTIEVVSFLGQTVLSQPNVGNTTKLDVSTLTNGVYFVRIISDNGANVQKFVKQ
ncbi:MAG: DUF2436 domain-containing protein [Bacteroidales bacterium]|jgi:hypothetical protein|nr:DUF2436 domain-containing protein [Bacteroidales bacterium]